MFLVTLIPAPPYRIEQNIFWLSFMSFWISFYYIESSRERCHNDDMTAKP